MGNPSRSNLEVDGDVTQFRAVSIPERCDVRRIERLDFKHLARKKGELQAEIVVGPSNPDFVALPSVGPLVVGAVLTCEDGSFFRHNGFMLRHINDSLRRDLHEKRFARGASTVSMQLVKNVFLNEQKTLSRKLQEMMLTWWLEKEVKKDRILETYLNIIEWGPKIYGVGPAARHYFHARPNELTPIQAAFLASIIANPVRYYYMKQRGVGDGWRINLEFILRKLVERGTIAQEDYDAAAATDFDVPFEKPPDAGDKTENPPAAKKSAPAGPTDASPAPSKPAPKKPAPKAAPPPNPPIDL
jgi:membrane peptidoglycan carboxypeptidase